MTRIALITPIFPYPLDSGTRIRIFHLARYLARRHTVRVLSLEPGDTTLATAALGAPVETLPVLALEGARERVGPFSFPRGIRERLWESVGQTGAEILHVEKSFGAALLGLPDRPVPLPVVLDEGCVHHISYWREARVAPTAAARARALLRWWRLRRFERRLAPVPHAVVAVSDGEAAYLRRLAPTARVVVAPNGMDTDTVRSSPPGDAILFVGLMSYLPNRDAVRFFVREILPRLDGSLGGREFLVAGRDPGPELEDLARRERRLRLLGFVGDLQPLYDRAGVFVNPMRGGGGTRIKILEALAAGKAVVSTTVGVEGLAVTPGRDVIVADSPATFAGAVRELLADPHRAWEIGRAGRALVEACYRWADCLAPLEALYAEPLCPRTGRC